MGSLVIGPKLKSLAINSMTLDSGTLSRLLRGNATLTRLHAMIPFSEDGIDLPPQLEDLNMGAHYGSYNRFTRFDPSLFTRLVKLEMNYFAGDLAGALPPSLRDLTLDNPRGFHGAHLTGQIQRLRINNTNLSPSEVAAFSVNFPNLEFLDCRPLVTLRRGREWASGKGEKQVRKAFLKRKYPKVELSLAIIHDDTWDNE
jgi:hypothetical protein